MTGLQLDAAETFRSLRLQQEQGVSVMVREYVWWIKYWHRLLGFIEGLETLGLKREAIKKQLIISFSKQGLARVEYFVYGRDVLLAEMKRRSNCPGFVFGVTEERCSIIIDAYNHLIGDFDVIMNNAPLV